jgi:hypothetical protein
MISMSAQIVTPLKNPDPTPRTPESHPARSPAMNRQAIPEMPTYHSRFVRISSISEPYASANHSVVSSVSSAMPSTAPANTAPHRIRCGLGEPTAGGAVDVV